jgi:DNA-binding protein
LEIPIIKSINFVKNGLFNKNIKHKFIKGIKVKDIKGKEEIERKRGKRIVKRNLFWNH